MCACACVCGVCVCVREIERERERENLLLYPPFSTFSYEADLLIALCHDIRAIFSKLMSHVT